MNKYLVLRVYDDGLRVVNLIRAWSEDDALDIAMEKSGRVMGIIQL